MMDREFWLAIREALLQIVGAIERLPEVKAKLKHTTKECRDIARRQR